MDNPSIGETTVQQPRCFGEKGFLTLSEASGGISPYRWTINNQPAAPGKQIEVNPGEIKIAVTDANNCTTDTVLTIETPADFTVFAGKDTLISYSDRIALSGTTSLPENSIRQIQWQPEDVFSCTNCLNPATSPESDVLCTLTVTDENGCTHTDEVLIRVRFDRGIIAPNIFNPSSNSGNQRFTLFASKNTVELILELVVYDRWGNVVFQKENFEAGNPELGWDGVWNGAAAIPGVYSWVAQVTYKDQSSEWLKGDITLIR
jgi:hypothetical protein